MPDDFDEAFTSLRRDAHTVRWAEPAHIRRRGQALSRHRLAATGAAVVTVVALAAGAVWAASDLRTPALGPAGPGLTSSPTTGPTTGSADPEPTSAPPPRPPDTIPSAAMLQREDVDEGEGYSVNDDPRGEDHGSLPMMMAYCGRTDYSDSQEHVAAMRPRIISAGEDRHVNQQVTRYQPGWAARHLDDLRAVLPECTSVQVMGDPQTLSTLTVVDSDFTGEGSLLIREVRDAPTGTTTQYHAVVHDGDTEARLRINIPGIGQDQARDIAVRAGARLCAANGTC